MENERLRAAALEATPTDAYDERTTAIDVVIPRSMSFVGDDAAAPLPSDTPADGLDAGLREALEWLIDNSTPVHTPECWSQDEDDPCICGVSDTYARLHAVLTKGPQEADR